MRRLRLPVLAAPRIGRHTYVLGHGTRAIDADQTLLARLRRAALVVVSSRSCRGLLGPRGQRQIVPLQTVCAVDRERPPGAGICVGDGGAPLVQRRRRWEILGVGSWANACGEFGAPSVFARAWSHRRFLMQRHPIWRPDMTRLAHLGGRAAVGATLTCVRPPSATRPDEVIYGFEDEIEGKVVQYGPSPTYVVRERDRGLSIRCYVLAFNAGGRGRTVSGNERFIPEAAGDEASQQAISAS